MSKKLQEVGYEKIFSPETMASLKGKSGESLRQMLGNKNLIQTITRSTQLLPQISQAEEEYKDELEMIAVQMVKDAYPIVDYAGIEIDAKITDDFSDMPIPNMQKTKEEWEEVNDDKKRRVINGITQGSSIRGAFGFMLYREYLDQLDPTLIEKYNEILKLSFGIYDNEEAIALLLSLLQQNQKIEGGRVFVKVNVPEEESEDEEEGKEEEPTLKIIARAMNFPMLVHEIVKGLYEILSLQGFGADKEKNKSIVDRIDRLQNEPDDLRYGKFIYDALSNIYNNSNFEDPRIRELFFTEIYKLEDDNFFPFIENALNNKLTSVQQRWANNTMKEIETDLKADDSDEILY